MRATDFWRWSILSAMMCFAAAAAAATTSPVGYWLGGPVESPRIQLSVTSNSEGMLSCTFDVLGQGIFGLPCGTATFSDNHFAFDVPAINGHWNGTLSDDAQTLTGTWNQGQSAALALHREARPLPASAAAKNASDPPMPPVAAAEMPAVIGADLRETLQSGALAPGTDAGVTIGVVRDGVQRVFAFGTARPDSIYEIGSITKTFTGLALAQMIEQHKVRLDEPVRELLPPGTVAKPAGAEITLLDLITHHSGLPSMPADVEPAGPGKSYENISVGDLYGLIARHGIAKPANASFLYSNFGVALLGQALAERSGKSYSKLVADEIIVPLGLHDTAASLTTKARSRLIQGHTAQHQSIAPWELNAFAGAGALHSTASDMLTYLLANLHPESISAGRTLPAALQLSHELRADAAGPVRIAFAWQYNSLTGDFMHDGVTSGYSAYTFFNPKGNYAAVVLMNTTVGPQGNFTVRLGQHIAARFAGQSALPLSN